MATNGRPQPTSNDKEAAIKFLPAQCSRWVEVRYKGNVSFLRGPFLYGADLQCSSKCSTFELTRRSVSALSANMATTTTKAEKPALEDVDFVPGTVHLVDLEGTMRAKHASGGKRDIVLVPTPSSDPDDPLNWSPTRKMLSTASMCMYTLMVGIASAAIYSVLVPISDATGLTLGDLNAGTGYMFLFFGWGCLVFQPLALQYGKRPVYLFSLLATMAIMVWVPHTKTNGQWIASKILQGFFGAPIESLCEISVTDIYFTHERGGYLALYGLLLAGSNFFAPIIAGFIADAQGWEWVLYWCAIFCAIGFVFCFFFMEETNYYRGEHSTAPPTGAQTPMTATNSGLATPDEKHPVIEPAKTEEGTGQVIYRQKTFMDKIKPFAAGTFARPNRLLGMIMRPLLLLSFPVISYSGFCYGSNLVWFNVLNATTSLILAGEPYNFAASLVGVAYVSPLIAVGVSSMYTGYFGNWFVIRMARHNKGIMEPEHRLWLFSASVLLLPFGLILWGVGAAHHVHWFGLIFAMAVIACTNAIGLQISVAYCIDSYRELGGEAIVTVILVRNTMSFAIGYGVTPWVRNLGYQNCFIVAAAAGVLQILSFLIFVKYGKTFRKNSTQRYFKYVKEMAKAGLVH